MLYSNEQIAEISELGCRLVYVGSLYINQVFVVDMRDEYESALAAQSAEIERLQVENAALQAYIDAKGGAASK